LRLQFSVDGSRAQEAMQLEQLKSHYKMQIDEANLVGADTSAIMEAWELEKDRIAKTHQSIRTQTILSGTAQLFGALGQLFEGNKKFAIAEALINTFQAVTAALKNPPGPPFTIPAAVAAGAFGLAQVQKIRSQRPGSGGGGSISGPGGGGGQIGAFSPTPTGPQQGPVEIRVFLEGEGYFQISPEELAQQMGNEYARQAHAAGQYIGGGDG